MFLVEHGCSCFLSEKGAENSQELRISQSKARVAVVTYIEMITRAFAHLFGSELLY